jgi:seryl-tRNA synthetase
MALGIKHLVDALNNELKSSSLKMYDIAGRVGNLLSSRVPEINAELFYIYDNKTGIDYNHDIFHADIMELLGLKWGSSISQISGNRAYLLSHHVFMLKHALMNYTIDFASKKGYNMMNVPVFMNHNSMQKVCQLSDFEDTLFEVTEKKQDDSSKFYLTATSEQFLVAYHSDKKLNKNELPLKYCAHNECFRKETGRHGKDTSGIFRIHQFDKFEQFVVCNPDDSDMELQKLLDIIKEFYESLGLSFKIIAMEAQDLNLSTSIKYDLEAYFPYSKSYKELVSCSNCTDYQSMKVDCKVGNNYVHMLNCTLCAIQRTLCCICETYWDNCSRTLKIPEVLKPFMNTDENYLKPI